MFRGIYFLPGLCRPGLYETRAMAYTGGRNWSLPYYLVAEGLSYPATSFRFSVQPERVKRTCIPRIPMGSVVGGGAMDGQGKERRENSIQYAALFFSSRFSLLIYKTKAGERERKKVKEKTNASYLLTVSSLLSSQQTNSFCLLFVHFVGSETYSSKCTSHHPSLALPAFSSPASPHYQQCRRPCPHQLASSPSEQHETVLPAAVASSSAAQAR